MEPVSMKSVRRLLFDLAALGLLLTKECVLRVCEQYSQLLSDWIAANVMLIEIGVPVIIACARGLVEVRIWKGKWPWWAAGTEWMAIVAVGFVGACWFDILSNPRDNFITVFSFNLLIVLMPSLIVSTVAYLLVITLARRLSSSPTLMK